MPGVGTLQRERVTARVERQADGSSLLLPPSETVAFVPSSAPTDDALAASLLRHLGTPNADPAGTLKQAIDQLEAHLAASGTAALPGIGTMQRSATGLTFGADPSLLAAVAQPYEGMAPVSAQTSEPAPTDASFIDEETLDDDLDDVLAAPLETSDPGGLRAVFPLPPTGDAPPPAEDIVPEPETESPILPAEGIPLAAATLVTSSPEDETQTWSAQPESPARPETPVLDIPAVSELVTPSTADALPDVPEADAARATPESSDLGWLEDYDADKEDDVDASGAALAGATMAAASPTPKASAPHLPKPPPIIAGPVEPTPKRGTPIWLWMLVPLLVLAALFFWYRSTQDTEPTEPILTAELAPDASDRLAQDTLTSSATAAADSAELAQEDPATVDTSAIASPIDDTASLEGEFPVEELTGSAASSTPPPPPAASRPAPAPARAAPSSPHTIDRPDLSGLSDADRESLIGTAPIVSGRGGFSWVVLSTRDRDPADLRARQYRDAGWRVRVFQTEALGDTVYRVAVGQFASRDQADRLRPFLPSQVPTDTWRLDLSTL